MLKHIRVKIETERYETSGSLFDSHMPLPFAYSMEEEPKPPAQANRMELLTEARYRDDGTRISISYEEGELSGMESATTTLSFSKSEPGIFSMTRTGPVRTTLLFEKGKRHTCVYQTPILPFEVCIATKNVQNDIEASGALYLDYLVELRGAQTEHTKFKLTVLPDFQAPLHSD